MEIVEPGMKINKALLNRYYEADLRRLKSMRRVAEHIGVSHTQLRNMLVDDKKTHVNIETARRFEDFFGVPRGVLFLAEALPVTRKTSAAA